MAGLPFVCVALPRADAAVGDFRHGFWQEETQAKTGKEREFRRAFHFQTDIYAAVLIYCPDGVDVEDALEIDCRQRETTLQYDLVCQQFLFLFLPGITARRKQSIFSDSTVQGKQDVLPGFTVHKIYLRPVSPTHRPLIPCPHPLLFDVAVVVSRRAPDIVFHRPLQQVLVVPDHPGEQTGAFVIDIAPVLSGQDD